MSKNHITIIKNLSFVLCFMALSHFIWASNGNEKSVFDEISYKEVVTINIEGNIDFLKENRRNQEKHEANFSYEDETGELKEWKVNLTIRGKYRRMFSKGIPPLKINFKKKDLINSGLSSSDDIKLVTLFHEDKDEAYQTLVKEFLTYKIYNTLTENSYRVQLVKINFKDVASGKKTKEYGFLIEDYAQVIDRIGAKKIEDPKSLLMNDYDGPHYEFVSMFQYMIGNSDWGLFINKNIEVCEKDGKVISIPFDFDFCGLVSASYAVPNNIYNIKSVRERIYLGVQDSLQYLDSIYQQFVDKKEEILKITNKSKLLNRRNRKKTTAYLESFFEDIETRKEHNLSMRDNIEEIMAAKQ